MSDAAGRTPLATRLLITGGIVAMALVLLMTGFVDRSIRQVWLDDLDERLAGIAAAVGAGLSDGSEQDLVSRAAESTGTRITLIAADGGVIADSHQDEALMESHADRPEVVAALDGERGRDTRLSRSSGFAQRYLALPAVDGIVVRVSTPVSVIDQQLAATRQAVAIAGLVVAALAISLLVLFARRLVRPVERLALQAQSVAAGDLTVEPERSSVVELDRLALALGAIVHDLGGRMEDAERASATLDAVLSTLPQGTLLFDGEDRLVYANASSRDLLGTVPPDLASLAPFQMQESVRAARTGTADTRELEHGLPARRLRAVATPVDADGSVVLVVADVTERARVEAMRRDFVANASHELKTPVATAIASAEALQIAMSRGDPSAEKFASQVVASAGHLERLVSDLLDLSRLEQETPQMASFNLGSVVGDEASQARARMEDNGLSLRVDAGDVVVSADEGAVRTAVRNLIDNAVRHTAGGGAIEVTVAERAGTAVIEVTDTGEGIPTADLARVFERFYRVDAARSRATGGTGLGLAIVRHVAESHGGRAMVRSELGAGSTFTVELPSSGCLPGGAVAERGSTAEGGEGARP